MFGCGVKLRLCMYTYTTERSRTDFTIYIKKEVHFSTKDNFFKWEQKFSRTKKLAKKYGVQFWLHSQSACSSKAIAPFFYAETLPAGGLSEKLPSTT